VLVDAVLGNITLHGWTDASIAAAVRDLGWSPAAAGLLPRGPATVVETIVERFNRDLALQLAEDEDAARSTPYYEAGTPHERAVFAIQTRLEMATPYKRSWSQALALQALPASLPKAITASAQLADEVAHYAGYQTPDVC
jgi:rpsU-divergently transcribed protein